MSLFDFFFPQVAQAAHLRELAESQKRQARAASYHSHSAAELETRVRDLEHDLGFMALLLGGILERLDRNGAITRDEVKQAMSALDDIDGVRDGRLDINILRGRHT